MELGRLIAETLRGAWRLRPPAPNLTAQELERVAPLLIERGEGALGWWRLRESALRASPPALRLQQTYFVQTVQAELYQAAVARLALALQSERVEALIGKGLPAAILYPEPGLRPAGDIDLYVRPEQYPRAVALLGKFNAQVSASGLFSVDLHCGATELDDRSFDRLIRRSRTIGDLRIRVFSSEDHLRLICLHALRHGMYRPLWLCDIAAALESRASDFDWDYFFSGDARRAGWIGCALRLANRLIDARLDRTPLAGRFTPLPAWMPRAVIKQWQKPTTPHGRRLPMVSHLRRRVGVAQALRQRWPNPIEATVKLRGPYDARLRLPFQIGNSLVRLAGLTRQLLAEP